MVPNRATHLIYTIENTKMEQRAILNGRWPINNLLFVTYCSPVFHFIRKLAKQMTGFYMKCNTALKWVKQSSFLVHKNEYHIKSKNCAELFSPGSFRPLTALKILQYKYLQVPKCITTIFIVWISNFKPYLLSANKVWRNFKVKKKYWSSFFLNNYNNQADYKKSNLILSRLPSRHLPTQS